METAKKDVIPFLKRKDVLNDWTKEYFLHWIKRMEFC